jgi:predicted nucleotidyltransferase
MKLVLPPGAHEALRELRTALPAQRIVLIGASALATHLPIARTTSDIDLLFMMAGDDPLPLIAPLGWYRSARISHRYHLGEVVADILPVSEAAFARGYVELTPGFPMNLAGCELAFTHYQTFPLTPSSVTLDVASLPALAVMKVASYLDRPHERVKDLEDLAFILQHALGEDHDLRWDSEHPINRTSRDFDAMSACYIGFCVGKLASDLHLALIDKLWALLEDEHSAAFAIVARASGLIDREATLKERIGAFRDGLRLV